ncbi:hypothetical protein PMIN04_008072 [Paraphaeosphaeria minitans]
MYSSPWLAWSMDLRVGMPRRSGEARGRFSPVQVQVFTAHKPSQLLRFPSSTQVAHHQLSRPRKPSFFPRPPERVPRDYAAQMSFITRTGSAAPAGYKAPPWPSLYWPLPVSASEPYYLYDPDDIWRFTLIWTALFFGAMHLVVAFWACIVQWRNWKIIWITPLLYAIIGGLEGLIAGSIVGGLLGGVYQSGDFKMSTWIPFVWGLISAVVLVLSSFAIHGGL